MVSVFTLNQIISVTILTILTIFTSVLFWLGGDPWWPTAAAAGTAAGASGCAWQCRGTAHLLRLKAPTLQVLTHYILSSLPLWTLRTPSRDSHISHLLSCCDVVEMWNIVMMFQKCSLCQSSLFPLKCGGDGSSGGTITQTFTLSYLILSSWCVCSISLLNE